jgi:hypothetical protein
MPRKRWLIVLTCFSSRRATLVGERSEITSAFAKRSMLQRFGSVEPVPPIVCSIRRKIAAKG